MTGDVVATISTRVKTETICRKCLAERQQKSIKPWNQLLTLTSGLTREKENPTMFWCLHGISVLCSTY